MGTGNLTELTDADSERRHRGADRHLLRARDPQRAGRAGVAAHAPHGARSTTRRAASCSARAPTRTCRRATAAQLLSLHDVAPLRHDAASEIAEVAAAVRDANYRIEAARTASTSTTATATTSRPIRSQLFDKLGVEADGAHAFYLGYELAKAEIARALGKRYAQDEPLDWGVAADRKAEDLTQHAPEGATLKRPQRGEGEAGCRGSSRRSSRRSTRTGEVHIAPLGLIADGDGWILAPFQPSRRSTTCARCRSRWPATPTTCACSPAA